MTETVEAQKAGKTSPLPFLLKAVAFFLAVDGVFKLSAIFFGALPGPEIFGYYMCFYYYGLVAVVDFSLTVQILGRAHYAWIWGLAFFVLQAVVLLTHFMITSPLAWLGPGILGRIQIVLSVALYLVLARYMASWRVRWILSPHEEEAGQTA